MIILLRNFLYLLLLSVFFSACGGSGSTDVSTSASPASFVAEKSAVPGSVTLQDGGGTGDTIYIDVVLTDVNNVFSTSIYLDYDPLVVNWSGSSSSGDFLEKSGSSPVYSLSLQNGIEGTLVIGISLLNPATPVSGSGTMVTIPFKVLARGSSPVTFSNLQVFNALPSEIGVSSGGGTITIL